MFVFEYLVATAAAEVDVYSAPGRSLYCVADVTKWIGHDPEVLEVVFVFDVCL